MKFYIVLLIFSSLQILVVFANENKKAQLSRRMLQNMELHANLSMCKRNYSILYLAYILLLLLLLLLLLKKRSTSYRPLSIYILLIRKKKEGKKERERKKEKRKSCALSLLYVIL
ncbi:uncharacterized protein BX663DRAFT_348129 [Cokeromyces recurvatus]|uniref:uncharacterized protein n=1 Tax=Cokeromyces recurvatus TaxID=90255 RepID=UPI00221FD44C|nr:uncharacterized protein BX663DRAFT_348129 [Cokeromyces recurvatus]KAI7903896.1 hypothetical protein BX663DRAFT_348129 [Cokeromyces recurvatus]